MLSENQFGFRNSHSTVHPMTHLLNAAARALNSKKHLLVIFCDLQKAFDTCNIKILLEKLYKVGIRGSELNWFKDYLHNRQQFVSIDDVCSDILIIINGVPQGSILGPLLFLLYINDLPNCSTLIALLFADDTGGRILGNTSGFKNKLNKAVSKKRVNIRGYILTRVKF